MQYQFQIDGRPAGSWHDHWALAAHDAVAFGQAVWITAEAIKLDPNSSIERREHAPVPV